MFEIEICKARMVALVRFGAELAEADFTALDKLASEARGNSHGFDCIFDMTEVTRVDLSHEFVALRGELSQAYPGRERIYVMRQGDLRLLTRFFAGYQATRQQREPVIVGTLDEAMDRLGVTHSDFEPVRMLQEPHVAAPARRSTPRRSRKR